MDTSNPSNQFTKSPGASPSARTPFPHTQTHMQPPPRPQPVQHQYCYPQATMTPNQLAHQMSDMQLQDNMHGGPSSMPPLDNSLLPALGMSGQGRMATQGLPRHSLMPLTAPQISMSPRFSLSNQDQGVSSGQQLGTPLPHHLWQQQISSPMPGRFSLASHQLSHPSSMAQQPIQQGYQGVLQPQYPQHPPAAGIPGLMPQFPPQPVLNQQQATELDPKSFPDAIQVMIENERDRSGPFFTHAKGLLPPMVTTNYVTSDQGNASPRFVRSSLYSVPESQEMLKESAVPLSIIVTPFARLERGEFAPPIVDCFKRGPIRCGECEAYMCSFMRFIEAGNKFYCPFCDTNTEVPPEYFQPLDHTGIRADKFQRPELYLGSYEFIVNENFCPGGDLPKPPGIVFIIDVSYSSVKSGLVRLLCRNMKSILASLPRESPDGPRPKVGFITYSNIVNMCSMCPTSTEVKMEDFDPVKVKPWPINYGCLMDPQEADDLIDQLMIKIEKKFADTQEIETILGPAIQVGLEALKASGCTGKLLVFNTSLPVKEGPGRLRMKDERKLLGTDREKKVLRPKSKYYKKLAKECMIYGVCVDLFLAHNDFIYVANIGQVARLTSGQIYKYTPCRAESDGERLMEDGELVVDDVKRNLERTWFDAKMRVRTSKGIQPVKFYGNFCENEEKELVIAGIQSEQAITIQLKHEGELNNQDGVYIQVAVSFTSVAGQRRLRVHNLSLNVTSKMEDLYSYCDLDAVMNSLLKQNVSKVEVSTPVDIKEGIFSRAAQILASFRRSISPPSLANELMLPGSLQLLPLLVNSLINCDAISGGEEMTVDARMFHIQSVISMNVEASHLYLYSSIIPLLDHTLHQRVEGEANSTPIRCSMDNLRDDGAYIIENGFSLYLWVGPLVDQHWIRCVFGVESAAHIDNTRTRLEEFDNPQSRMVRDALAKVRGSRQRQMRLRIIRPRDKLEYECRKLLSEDKNLFNRSSFSYPYFTRQLYWEVQALLPQ